MSDRDVFFFFFQYRSTHVTLRTQYYDSVKKKTQYFNSPAEM